MEQNEKRKRVFFCIGIGILLTIVLFLLSVHDMDTVPATINDYKELEDIARNNEHDIEAILESMFPDGIVEVTLSNDECEVTVVYNKSLDLVSISRKDNCVSKFEFIFMGIFVPIFLGCCVGIFLYSILKDIHKALQSRKR